MIRTTVVGSWPIPFGLKPRLTDYYKGVLSDDAAHDVLQAAARIAMDEQLACGLDQVRRTVHFCLGDMGRRPAAHEQHLRHLIPLFQALEGSVERVHVECSYAGQWAEHALLAEIPDSMEVIAGIADVKAKPQNESDLRERIHALLRVLPAERLLVSSSCGCGRVPHDEAIELMRNLVQAARAV